MAPPVRCELVSRGRAVCRILADALHEVIFNRLPCLREEWGQFSGSPLPCPYPCACPLPCLSRHPPRDRSLAGRPSHPHALPGGGRDHSTPPTAMAEGVLRPPARARLIIHHAKPPPARGTPVHKPSIALSHFSPHVTVRRRWALSHGLDAAALTTFSRAAARSKSVASASWAGRTMLRRSRGRAGPQGRLWGSDARSACRSPGGGCSTVPRMVSTRLFLRVRACCLVFP